MHELARARCRPRQGARFEAGGVEYELGGKLGDGAVGRVHTARGKTRDREVAVKFLAPDPNYIELSSFDEVSERFRREGERGAGLEHPHLVKIIAFENNTNGECFRRGSVKNPFIVMEKVRGKTLESTIRNTRRLADEVHVNLATLTIATSIISALRYLHDRKITHRDVKPANVFVSTTRPGMAPSVIKLGDFGVTKWGDFLAAASTGTLTMSHQQGLGTLKYMSPEQATRPKDVTVRSDIFSLGVTLYELLTGEILPTPHHVFDIMIARNMRGPVEGKLHSLGLRALAGFEVLVLGDVLDMFLAAKGRPTSRGLVGRFEYCLEQLEGAIDPED